MEKTKTVSESRSSISHLMEPGQANIAGNVHGGEIMKLMDNTAGIVARRHARSSVVTARVDQLEFHLPIHIGDLVTCEGQITFAGKHSMEILVRVLVDDFEEGSETRLALTSYFTMVALGAEGRPAAVPALEVKTKEEKKLYHEAEERYLAYKEKRRSASPSR